MNSVVRTVLEMMGLVALASGLGLAGNAWRSSHSITLTKNYFDTSSIATQARQAAEAAARDAAAPAPAGPTQPDPAAPAVVAQAEPDTAPAADAEPSDGKAKIGSDYGLQTMDYAGVWEVYTDPMYAAGYCLIIDARGDSLYEAGHIPGARQLDHYRLAEFLPGLLDIALAADRIIVYCEGGECEDSIFAANDLLEAGVGYDKVFLYPGGFEDWEANDGPLEMGNPN